jgi:putative endonuclease
MYYVYVLLSERDNLFYVGYSQKVDERLKCHNSGKNQSTRSRRPFKLLYYEAHTSKVDAMRREKYFKTTKGKVTINQILRDALETFRN